MQVNSSVLSRLLVVLSIASCPVASAEEGSLTIWLMPKESIPNDELITNQLEKLKSDEPNSAEQTKLIQQLEEQLNIELTKYIGWNKATPAQRQLGSKLLDNEVFLSLFKKAIDEDFPGVQLVNLSPPDSFELDSAHVDYNRQTIRLLASQYDTLRHLSAISSDMKRVIKVRFATWARAFGELQDPKNIVPPDVAEIGSTWAHYFTKQRLIVPPGTGNGSFRVPSKFIRKLTISDKELPSSLLYTVDLKFIYYWRRPVGTGVTGSPQTLDLAEVDSWADVAERINQHLGAISNHDPRYQFVFPIGMSIHLLFDWQMLVESEGKLISGTKAVFDDDAAMRAASVLATATRELEGGRTHRLFAFPNETHEDTTQRFLRGAVLATVEGPGFAKRSYEHLVQSLKLPDDESVWDYLGVALPPRRTFRGGSDLAVFGQSGHGSHEEAFDLASRFSKAMMPVLYSEGHLPAQESFILHDGALGDGLAKVLNGIELGKRYRAGTPKSDLPKGAQSFVDTLDTVWDDKSKWCDHDVLARFSRELEDRRIQIGFQELWLAIGRGNESEVNEKTRELAYAINLNIDPATIEEDKWRKAGTKILAVSLALLVPIFVLAAVMLNTQRNAANARANAEKENAEAKDAKLQAVERLRAQEREALAQHRRSLSMLSMLFTQIDHRHRNSRTWMKNTLGDALLDDENDAQRAEMVLAGIRDLARTLQPGTPVSITVADVCYRALLRAIDNVMDGYVGIYDNWIRGKLPGPGRTQQHKLKPTDARSYFDSYGPQRDFSLSVADDLGRKHCRDTVVVEFCLACILQNAIQESERWSDDLRQQQQKHAGDASVAKTPMISIGYTATPRPGIVVENVKRERTLIDQRIVALLRDHPFDAANAEQVLRDFFPDTQESDSIGLGLILAKTTSELFLGGLDVNFDHDPVQVTIYLGGAYLEHSDSNKAES